jgi:hypothetical protein
MFLVRRAGQILQADYDEIEDHIKKSKHLTPDQTGWRIGGSLVWLHGLVGDDGATLYTIDPQRSAHVLEKKSSASTGREHDSRWIFVLRAF